MLSNEVCSKCPINDLPEEERGQVVRARNYVLRGICVNALDAADYLKLDGEQARAATGCIPDNRLQEACLDEIF